MLLANSQQNGPILNLSRSWIRTGVFIGGLPPPVGEDSAGAPEPWGLRPTESTPRVKGAWACGGLGERAAFSLLPLLQQQDEVTAG